MLALSACATKEQVYKFYRNCDNQISYVYCPAPPSNYKGGKVNADGALIELNQKETATMSIIKSDIPDAEKVAKLRELGYEYRSGANTLEFILCSQYVSCALTREQYKLSRRNIVNVIDK